MSPKQFFHFRNISLKTRLSLAVALLFVLALGLLSTLAISVFEKTLEKVIEARQSTLIANMADEVDQKINLRRTALTRLAHDIGAAELDKDQLQDYLGQFHSLDGLFDNFVIADLNGNQLANMDSPEARGKLNIADRDYFQAAVKQYTAVISAPLKSGMTGRPLVLMSAPIFNTRGSLLFVLLGTIELTHDSFLSELSNAKIGETGYFYVLTAKGSFVSHPDQSRILKNLSELPAQGGIPAQVLQQAEGTTTSGKGGNDEAILSYRHLKSVDWIVAAVYPKSEAFSTIAEVRNHAIVASIALLLGLLLLTWWFMYWQLSPLQKLRDKVNNAEAGPDLADADTSYHKDEIGDLAKAFDDAMRKRRAAELALSNSENNLRLIADNMSAFIGYIDKHEKYTFANKKIEHLFGIPAHQVIGRAVQDIAGTPFYLQTQPYIARVMTGLWTRFERRAERKGVLEWDRVTYVPDISRDGEVLGFFVLVEDITEFKRIQTDLMLSEKRILTITDNIPAMIAYVDAHERYQFCNRYSRMMSGVDQAEIVGKTVKEVFGDAPYLELREKIHRALHGEAVSFERFATERGLYKHLQYEYVPDVNTEGETLGFYAMIIDVSDRKEAELKLQASEGLLRTIADNIPAFVSFIDTDNHFQFVNRPYETWFNLPLVAIRGRALSSLLTGDLLELHQTHFMYALSGERTEFEIEIEIAGVLGHYHATYVPQFNDVGKVIGVNSLINDVSDAKAVEKQLLALARFDSLTALPNRNQLEERMEQASARSQRTGRLMAIMFLDIDHFKDINDNLGHHAGDEVLKEFASRLKSCIRQTDLVGRLGGDEFVIILEGLNAHAEAELVAGKIIQAMTVPVIAEGQPHMITASIGIAICGEKKHSGEQMLKKADEALYLVKKAGRNNFKVLQMD